MPKQVPFRNRSQYGWWVFCEVQKHVLQRKPGTPGQKRFRVWENMRLIKARNREEAYRKAMRIAQAGMPSKTDSGELRFVGLSLLPPMYEPLEDGAEILWTDFGKISDARLKRMIKPKAKLAAFDDRDLVRGN